MSATAQPSSPPSDTDHLRLLAILQIVYSALGLVIGGLLLMLFGGVGMAISIKAAMEDPNAVAAPAIVGAILTLIAILVIVLSLPGVIAGWGLLKGFAWARVLTIVLSALNLFSVPLGTAVGIYGLWVLTRPEIEARFRGNGGGSHSVRPQTA